MIITKTPYRISLFGGGTDYKEWYSKNGGKIISATIDKYIYITCRKLPPFFKHKHRIVYSKIENVKNEKNIKLNVIREGIKYFKFKEGLEIHYDGDLPAKSGMGSSSAFVAGSLLALNKLKKNKNLNKLSLAIKAIKFEQEILKEPVGIQDQISASYGGFNKIIIKKNGKFIIKKIFKNNLKLKKLNDRLFLVYTNNKRKINMIPKKYIKKLNGDKKKQTEFIFNSVDKALNILKSNDFDRLGPLLHETWLKKKELSSIISNKKINDLYELGLKSGATGGKLLGAGGGGFILFYVPKKNQNNFKTKLKKKILIPFKFENTGSKILLNK